MFPSFITLPQATGIAVGTAVLSGISAQGRRGWALDESGEVPLWADYRVAAIASPFILKFVEMGLQRLAPGVYYSAASFLSIAGDVAKIASISGAISLLASESADAAINGSFLGIPVPQVLLPAPAEIG